MPGVKVWFRTATAKRQRPNGLRCACRYAALAIVASCLISAQTPQAPKLSIGAASFNGNAGKVTFRAIYSDQSPPSAEAQQKYWHETLDGKYVVVLDPAKITPLSDTDFGDFTFRASVKREADKTWYSYDVVASPSGTFADIQKDVNFTVGQEGRATVNIKLPLHSANYENALQWVKDDPPTAEIGVSASQGPVITLQNSLDGLGIHVTRVAVAKENCPQCWQESQQQTVTAVAPGEKIYPALNIRPKSLSALWSTASTKPGATQDMLSVVVDYSVDEGGGMKHLQITLPVRFSPSVWHLALMVVAGAMLGIVLAAVVPKIKHRAKGAKATDLAPAAQSEDLQKSMWAKVWHGLTTVFLTGVAVGLLVFLASRDSKLVILGLDMDPRQMVPAFIVAALIAGGSRVKTWAAGIVGWGQGKGSGMAAGAGGD